MSIKQEFHQLLKEYLQHPSEQLKMRIQKKMYHPSFIQESSLLAEDHPLKLEAVLIRDGFESVTNGMADSHLMQQVEQIEDQSLFSSWKWLILSFRSLYAKDSVQLERSLSRIPLSSAPGRLVPVIQSYIHPGSVSLDDAQSKLFHAVFKENSVIGDLSFQLKECSEAGLQDHFLKALPLFLRELKKESHLLAERGALWALDHLVQEEPLSEESLPYLSSVFDPAVAFRLLAVSSFEYDTDRTLFFWIESFNEYLNSGSAGIIESEIRIEMLKEIWTLVQERYDVTDEYCAGLRHRLQMLEKNLNHAFPGKDWNISELLEEEAPVPNRTEPGRNVQFVQLELAF